MAMDPHPSHRVLQRAETICSERGAKLTPMRRRVLQALAESHAPPTASDLITRMSDEDGKRISPVLVYRALEFLTGIGLVHHLASRNAYTPCDHEHREDEATVFLVCAECGGVDEVVSREVERGLEGSASAAGFRPLAQVVEVEGECAACRADR